MISWFSKPWSPRIYGFYHTKTPQKILESIWKHPLKILFFHISTFWNFENFSNLDPLNTYFFWKLFGGPPLKRLVYIIVFEGHFPWYILEILKRPLILTKCKIISKSQWINNIFQRVTYHLTKNLSPHTFLVFMDHSNSWFFSPRTSLVFMENPLFEL